MELDPIKYEIFFNKLDQLLNEGKEVIRYLSGSTIVREAGEALEAFYLPDGEAVDIACGILMHFMNITRIIRYMNANRYDASDIGIYDGDQFINNDAYLGGMHSPDTGIVAPFFYKGELLGYFAAISHTTETGGIEPGGMCPTATEAWHDGIHMPAIKLVERGKMRRDVFNMILRAVRDQRTMELDIRARIAGNERSRQRLVELVEEFGVDFFKAATKQLVKDGEEFTRAKIKRLKPGIYSGRGYCDTLGGGREGLCVIQVDLEIKEEGRMVVRTPVISPQKPCFNNAYLPAVEATIMYTLLTQLVYDGRWNSGMANLVDMEVPEGSRLNADPSQSVGYATVGIGFTLCAALTEALSRAYYASGIENEVQAPPSGSCNFPILSGIDQFGRIYGNILLSNACYMSGGGRIGEDGVGNYHFYNPWQYCTDAEGEEMITPSLHLLIDALPDSGGFGKWRGGTTGCNIGMVHKSNNVFLSFNGIGSKIAPNQGIFGGYPGPVSYVDVIKNNNISDLIKEGGRLPQEVLDIVDIRSIVSGNYKHWGTSVPTQSMKSGDIWVALSSGGGGGVGDPIERDPKLILDDIKSKRTTIEIARRVYFLSIDDNLNIDYEKTEKLREDRRRERLSKGISAKDYVKNMIERRKRGEIPKPSIELINDLINFLPAFREQLRFEEEFIEKDAKPIGDVMGKNLLFNLTPYINIFEDDNRRIIAQCSRCGFGYCDADEDYKLYSLIYDRDPLENFPKYLAPDREWCIYREFYCPSCGVQIEVDGTPEGMPIIPNSRITKIKEV